MALRIQARDENEARISRRPAGKSFFQKPDAKPRAALGSIANTFLERNAPGKAPQHVNQQPLVLRQPMRAPVSVVTTEEPVKAVVKPHNERGRFAEPEEMEVGQVTTALAKQLHIEDIDSSDAENPQLCAEYVKEIYQYMRDLERKYHVEPTFIQRQPQINAKMRAILIDWLIQVHLRFTLLQETLYLTISVIDRYLQAQEVAKSKLQLVGVTAMLIASKYEEMYAPEVRDFVYITDNTYPSVEIRNMERNMLRAMDYSLGGPQCLHFLRRFSRAGEATPEIHTMAKFLMELCVTEYSMLQFLPSHIAAAALNLAMKAYNAGEWTPTLRHYSNYSEEDLTQCVCKMARLVVNMHSAKQQAVRSKYSSSKFLRIAKSEVLHSQVVKDLAKAAAQ